MTDDQPTEAIMLTAVERARFAQWLDQEADGNEVMATQWEKLGRWMAPSGHFWHGQIYEMMANELRNTALAFRGVAMKLRSIEDMQLTASEETERAIQEGV